MKLAEVTSIDVNRTKTEMDEFNRVLGGGVVPGSLVLIGGDPGIGKSTLLLQVSTQLSHQGTVLYVSGEESAEQIKLRAERLGDIDSEFYLYAETNMQNIRTEIEKIKPDFLIIDSIQTVMSPEISSVQGSVSQVREVTAELMQLAKTNNIAIFIVGIPSALSYGVLADVQIFGKTFFDAMDFLVSNLLMPFGALCLSLFTGYIFEKTLAMKELHLDETPWKQSLFQVWLFLLRYIIPIIIIVVFIAQFM